MTDYEETRRRRKPKTQIRNKPTVKHILFSCPDIECNYSCMLEVPIGWTGVHRCSKCGKPMQEV